MRVLHVIPSLAAQDGGPANAVLLMERALRLHGVHVDIASTESASRRSPAFPNRIVFNRRVEFYKVAPGFVPWARTHLRDYDVVHVHAMFTFMSNAAAVVAGLRGVPYVVRPLGTLNLYGMTQRRPLVKRLSFLALERHLLNRAAMVQFTSEAELQESRRTHPCPRAAIVPIGVEVHPSTLESARGSQLPVPEGPFILAIGRIDPVKNIELLLDAFAQVRKRVPTVSLVLAGTGDPAYTASLRDRAARLQVADGVKWLGHVEGGLKLRLLREAAIFAMPSHSESFGIAAVEAMLAGRPCVLSSGVAIAAQAAAAHAALVPAQDPQAFAATLVRLLEAPEHAQALGRRGLTFASSRYSVEAMGASLLRMYEDVLAAHGRVSRAAASYPED